MDVGDLFVLSDFEQHVRRSESTVNIKVVDAHLHAGVETPLVHLVLDVTVQNMVHCSVEASRLKHLDKGVIVELLCVIKSVKVRINNSLTVLVLESLVDNQLVPAVGSDHDVASLQRLEEQLQ